MPCLPLLRRPWCCAARRSPWRPRPGRASCRNATWPSATARGSRWPRAGKDARQGRCPCWATTANRCPARCATSRWPAGPWSRNSTAGEHRVVRTLTIADDGAWIRVVTRFEPAGRVTLRQLSDRVKFSAPAGLVVLAFRGRLQSGRPVQGPADPRPGGPRGPGDRARPGGLAPRRIEALHSRAGSRRARRARRSAWASCPPGWPRMRSTRSIRSAPGPRTRPSRTPITCWSRPPPRPRRPIARRSGSTGTQFGRVGAGARRGPAGGHRSALPLAGPVG